MRNVLLLQDAPGRALSVAAAVADVVDTRAICIDSASARLFVVTAALELVCYDLDGAQVWFSLLAPSRHLLRAHRAIFCIGIRLVKLMDPSFHHLRPLF